MSNVCIPIEKLAKFPPLKPGWILKTIKQNPLLEENYPADCESLQIFLYISVNICDVKVKKYF